MNERGLFPRGKNYFPKGKNASSPRGNINFPGVKATPSWKTLLSFGGNVSFFGRKLPPGKKGTSQGGALRKSVSVTALANQFEGKLTHSL